MITVIVDTTATFDDLTMKTTSWMQMLTLCHNSTVQLVIPDVVLRGTARHWAAQAAEAIKIANGKIGGLKKSRDRPLRRWRPRPAVILASETLRSSGSG